MKAVLPASATPWNFCDELVTMNGLFFKGDRIVIPSVLRSEMLEQKKESRMDLYLALLEPRCTPVDSLESPAKLLMSQNLRSVVPATDTHLKPKVVKPSKAVRQGSICQDR